MSERTTALADRFEQANGEIIETVERCSDAQWRAKTSGEGWPVGVVAHHVAEGHKAIAGLVQLIATGQPLPGLTREKLDEMNAEHAKQHANCTKAETLQLLRTAAATAAATIRGLSDDQLERTASVLGGPPMSAQQAIDRILIGHVHEHLANIKTAVGA
jgi:uncharacterized damage-inducible protein DinB